jgi:hypothetical protein
MPRSFAMKDRSLPKAARAAISLATTLLMALTMSTELQAQGPALTTISEVRYSDGGWGISNSRNLVGRFTSASFSLTRYSRSQTYFLRSYDGSGPPKYSRYSAALHVDYPL